MNRCSVCDCGFEGSLNGVCDSPVLWSQEYSAWICETCSKEIQISILEMEQDTQDDMATELDQDAGQHDDTEFLDEMEVDLEGLGLLEVSGMEGFEGQAHRDSVLSEED